ncbi:MAG: protoglobin family protein [Planctomycetota bacterium]
MKTIDEARLETDLGYRFQYLAEFIGFGPEDHAAIQTAAMDLGPMIPQLVDATYDKLLAYDATARHFLPRQAGCDGPLPRSLDDLSGSAPIQFRKEHLGRYLMQLLGRSFDSKMAIYLDMVGKMHTKNAGNAEIHVPLVQMNALMGLLSDVLSNAISQMPLDVASMLKTIRAFQKLLWIQNDFIARHYSETTARTRS